MWTVINIIQLILILLLSVLCMTTAVIFGSIGFKDSMMWMGRNIWARGIIYITGCRVIIRGIENLDLNTPHIYVSNHLSHFDIPILLYAIPKPLYFVAKKELEKVPFLGWSCKAVGMIFIDRKNRTKAQLSLIEAGKKIKAGKNIITFPEGTRSKTGEINSFKRGTFAIAIEGKVKISPIALSGVHKLNPPGTKRLRPTTITIEIGKTIEYKDFENMTSDSLANHVEKIVRNLQKETDRL